MFATNVFFHNKVAVYTGGSQLEWREVETGKLPSPLAKLRASMIDNTIFVTGGKGNDNSYPTSILLWDMSSESWKSAGNLAKGRYDHAAVAVSSSIISCSAKLLA